MGVQQCDANFFVYFYIFIIIVHDGGKQKGDNQLITNVKIGERPAPQ